ncbi:butyrophilin subfamily 1 member A1-like isoform X2 [Gopherus evgoodei]|uniref:butyrophilin subfamily 1 member A1-like isoform X2 n=1 Tax=Gopherus evgoodei TaxID=1825980 RepID=UPI0011CEE351|nr:butyrophilin subfamily 1 member A1-like isoform X2 [Gopherus evgoodei]
MAGESHVIRKMKVSSFHHGPVMSSSLPGYIMFFIILSIHKGDSAQFKVIGPDHPVMATAGEDIVLPCHLSPRVSAENMEVRWYQSQFYSLVHLYRDGDNQNERQMPEYQGRTEFLRDDIANGSVALRIRHVRPSDEGQYKCFFRSSVFHEESLLELKVAGLGSAPLISVEGYQDGGIRMVCRSAGWYPEPEVLWRDPSGQPLTSLSETKPRGANGLFETQSSIIMSETSNQSLSCHIRNTLLNQEKESTVYIAGPFFPRVSPWMVALCVLLVTAFVLIGVAAFLFKLRGNLHAKIRKIQAEKRKLLENISELQEEIRRLQAEIGKHLDNISELHEEIRAHLENISRLQRELEWRKALVCPTNVTLDPNTANAQLIVSEDRKSVRRGIAQQEVPDNPERFHSFCLLGCERFTSGRHYWEVEVGDGGFWAVGVARESMRRKGGIRFNPEQGIWAVERCGDQYRALTSPETPMPLSERPKKIGVYLDYEAEWVAFYDTGNETLIFTFMSASFTGETILPFFWVGIGVLLRVCP